jgi:hypothetical protein
MEAEFIELIITTIVALVALGARSYLRSNQEPGKMANVMRLATSIVQGVELYGRDREDVGGADKLALAVSALTAGAKRFGVKLSDDEAKAIVHSALAEVRVLFEELDNSAANPYDPQVESVVQQLQLVDSDNLPEV